MKGFGKVKEMQRKIKERQLKVKVKERLRGMAKERQ